MGKCFSKQMIFIILLLPTFDITFLADVMPLCWSMADVFCHVVYVLPLIFEADVNLCIYHLFWLMICQLYGG